MNKKQVIDFLEKAGIWVKDGKIAKADIQKVKEAMAGHKVVAVSDEMTEAQAQTLKKIYEMLETLGDEAKEHLVTNLYQVAEVLEDSEGKERFDMINDKFSAFINKTKAGYVSIHLKPGDKVKCINDKKYIRQYGSGPDWTVPSGIKEGEIYTVVDIVKDYFGANKIMLEVDGKNVVVDTLYMDGKNYGQRFENVDKPDRDISNVI
jgi:hypothetical protein